jgi:hypothetical protein
MKLWKTALGAALAVACLALGHPADASIAARDQRTNALKDMCTQTQGGQEIPCDVYYLQQDDGTFAPAKATATFEIKGHKTLAVSTTSAPTTLPTSDRSLVLQNLGTSDIYLKMGGVSVSAATTDFVLRAGKSMGLSSGGNLYIAGITASGTSTLDITTGVGVPVFDGGGGSSGGGAITIADGGDVTKGAKIDTAWDLSVGSPTMMAVNKAIALKIEAARALLAGNLTVNTHAVTQSGTWNIGSITTLPSIPAGTNLIGKFGIDQTTPGTTNLVAAGQNGTWNINNIAGTISLPNGAATSAKQPALGTAGSPSTDVITVQGATSGTGLPVKLADGVDVSQGAVADAAWTTGSCSVISCLKAIAGAAISTTPAAVKTDQTTHGTTDLVAADITKVGGNAALAGLGNVGSGSQRMFSAFAGGAQASVNISTATTTQVIPLSGSLTTYVLFEQLTAGGTGDATWKYGTGTNCGTGTTTMEGVYNLTAQNGYNNGNGAAPVRIVPAGQALCLTTSAAVQYTGRLIYVQF